MRTRVLALLLFPVLLSIAACDKPTEADCQKAVDNINKIYGEAGGAKETAPAVRKCRSSSKSAAVQCMINAKTADDLKVCESK
jgi:hypothetical protein